MHIPVLTEEVLELLNPKENENFIDCTIGEGGHTAAILEKNGPNGKVLGIELDTEIYKLTKPRVVEFPVSSFQFKNRLILINDSYVNLKKIIEKENFNSINGILLDLGYSSWQLEGSEKGFSFKLNQMLDMRYNSETVMTKFQIPNYLTAEKIVNEWTEDKIEEILKEYGEEKFANKITKSIVEERKRGRIKSTFQLVNIIKKAVPLKFQYGRIHCATRTFQALRIAVNDELNNLTRVLPDIISVLSSGGRIVIISFHSLEDRIVKKFFQDREKEGIIKILTKKPLTAKALELKVNPRSRSAKLRAFIKLVD